MLSDLDVAKLWLIFGLSVCLVSGFGFYLVYLVTVRQLDISEKEKDREYIHKETQHGN